MATTNVCDPNSSFFGLMGITSAMVFSNLGAAYGTAKSGVGASSVSVLRPDLMIRSLVPLIMAGVLALYGLIVSFMIMNGLDTPETYSAYMGYRQLTAGLVTGLAALGAGLAIGIIGDAAVRAYGQQPRLFIGMLLMLSLCEALALYGFIIGIMLGTSSFPGLCTSYKVA